MLVGVLDAGFRGFTRGSVRFGYCGLVWLCLLRISVVCGVGFLFGCAVWGLLSGLTGCDAVRFGLGVLLWLCWFVALIGGLFTCAFRFLLLFFWVSITLFRLWLELLISVF